jgi:sulfoacetaldehyde dehydrogenase
VQEGVYDELMGLLQAEGGYLATPEEKEKIQKVHWINGDLNREVITQSAATIAKLAGIAIPENTKFIMVEETGIGKDIPFVGKASLVLTFYSRQLRRSHS